MSERSHPIMTSEQRRHIDEDIFTVSGVFSREECAELIRRAEAIGFEAATVRTADGPKMMKHIRDNERVVLTDEALAAELWRRIADHVSEVDGRAPCGVDAQLRFYRYLLGQRFKRHRDGAVTDALGHTSELSYLIYLNDDCEGGATIFRDHLDVAGERITREHIITPEAGTALLFRHARWHEGTPVLLWSNVLDRLADQLTPLLTICAFTELSLV